MKKTIYVLVEIFSPDLRIARGTTGVVLGAYADFDEARKAMEWEILQESDDGYVPDIVCEKQALLYLNGKRDNPLWVEFAIKEVDFNLKFEKALNA